MLQGRYPCAGPVTGNRFSAVTIMRPLAREPKGGVTFTHRQRGNRVSNIKKAIFAGYAVLAPYFGYVAMTEGQSAGIMFGACMMGMALLLRSSPEQSWR